MTAISDNFNRADGALGASWQNFNGNPRILGNAMLATAGGAFSYARHLTALATPHHKSSVTLPMPNGGRNAISHYALCFVRLNAATGNPSTDVLGYYGGVNWTDVAANDIWLIGGYTTAGAAVTLAGNVSGNLYTARGNVGIAAGDSIELQANGNQLRLLYNGVQIGMVANGAVGTGLYTGCGIYEATGVGFASVDNFAASDLGAQGNAFAVL